MFSFLTQKTFSTLWNLEVFQTPLKICLSLPVPSSLLSPPSHNPRGSHVISNQPQESTPSFLLPLPPPGAHGTIIERRLVWIAWSSFWASMWREKFRYMMGKSLKYLKVRSVRWGEGSFWYVMGWSEMPIFGTMLEGINWCWVHMNTDS